MTLFWIVVGRRSSPSFAERFRAGDLKVAIRAYRELAASVPDAFWHIEW